jgi:hypothetical protein
MPDGTTWSCPQNRPSYGPHPDAVLLNRRRTHRAIVATKLAIALAMPFECKTKNTIPPIHRKPKTCPACKTTYTQAAGNFGKGGTRTYCSSCQGKPAAKPKTCCDCGTTYPETEKYFRRGGKIHKHCHTCAEARVRAKIEARIAKRAHSCKA